MYDLRFIFDECGFGHVPDYIDRSRLFNVSLDLTSGDIKLYVLDASERFAHKITRSGITRQYSGDDPEHGGDHGRLERHLKCKLLEREIVIDAVEDETYYVYLDDAGVGQSLLFLGALCRVHGLGENAVLQSIDTVCGNSFATIAAALEQHAVSLVKVPLAGGDVKIYARPYLRGWRFPLNQKATSFLCRLLACAQSDLEPQLKHLWVTREIGSGAVAIVTQRHNLLHDEQQRPAPT
jgi:hypothetical protein